MNCSDIRPMLSAFYDGEATPEEYDLVERHVASCPDCRRVMAEYRAIGGGIRALPVPVPPAGLRRDVWRAIEVQRPTRGANTARPARPVTSTAREERKPTPLGPLANIGRGWGKVVPATALLAAMLLIFAVAVVLNPPGRVGAAHLEDELPIKDYNQTLHVRFDKQVTRTDAENYTYLLLLGGSQPVTMTNGIQIQNTYDQNTHVLAIKPKYALEAGAKYEVYVDASKINQLGNMQVLQDDPIRLPFDTLAYTPTPTNTATPTPTATRTPTARIEPTRVANNTPAVPPTAVRNSPTPAARPSNTPAPATATLPSTPTRTPPATRTAQPSTSPTAKSTQTPTVTVTVTPTATPGRKNTQTPGPRITGTPRVSVTPTPPCSIMPVSGFGKLWREHEDVRSRLGCPTAYEIPLQQAAEEHFQGGYMFWRGDTNTIYVFVGTNFGGSVYQYQDTWQEDDPTPVPGPTPPPGLYAPVRGFGKIWSANPGLRQALGWATDQEAGRTGAWQPFTGGSGLWTSDRVIRVLYDDGTWESYPDNYVTPTPAAHPPATNKP